MRNLWLNIGSAAKNVQTPKGVACNAQAPRRGALIIGRRFSAGTQKQKGIAVPEGRGESVRIVQNIFTCCYFPDSITSPARKSITVQRASKRNTSVFSGKHGYPDHLLTAPFTPPLRDGADLKSYETGAEAEAPAYCLSAPPGRGCVTGD